MEQIVEEISLERDFPINFAKHFTVNKKQKINWNKKMSCLSQTNEGIETFNCQHIHFFEKRRELHQSNTFKKLLINKTLKQKKIFEKISMKSF